MRIALKYLVTMCGMLLVMGAFSGPLAAQVVFTDDFEDRVQDQAVIGNDWTWYDQWYSDQACTEYAGGFGPFDDGDSSDYEAANRNFFTVPEGSGDYYRAGLEVPAWDGALTNMLRVYGNQYNVEGVCQRTLIFQEMDAPAAGTYSFSFDVAQDKDGAPANGETTAAFVKVLDPSNGYAEILFESVKTIPPAATTPENVTTLLHAVEFTIEEEMVGKLLQFGFYNDLVPEFGHSWGTSAVLYDNIKLAPMEIGPAHSGSWFNRDQSGHGFSIVIGVLPSGAPLVVVYWYIFDTAGNPIFLVGTGSPVGNTVEITLTSPVGMIYGDFDPSTMPDPHNAGGTAIFEFSDRENGVFSYTPSDFTAETWGHTAVDSLPITRLFGIPADKFFPTVE